MPNDQTPVKGESVSYLPMILLNLEYHKKELTEGTINFWNDKKDKLDEIIKALNNK